MTTTKLHGTCYGKHIIVDSLINMYRMFAITKIFLLPGLCCKRMFTDGAANLFQCGKGLSMLSFIRKDPGDVLNQIYKLQLAATEKHFINI